LSFGDLRRKEFGYLLFILVCVAGSLFGILTFVATTEFDEATGVVLFLVVTGLIIGGYMVGVLVLAFLAVVVLPKLIVKPSKPNSMQRSS